MLPVAPRGKDVAPVVEPPRRAFVEVARRGPEHRVAATGQLVVAGGLAAHRRAAVVQHRVAHAPTGKRRLVTSHTHNGHQAEIPCCSSEATSSPYQSNRLSLYDAAT